MCGDPSTKSNLSPLSTMAIERSTVVTLREKGSNANYTYVATSLASTAINA